MISWTVHSRYFRNKEGIPIKKFKSYSISTRGKTRLEITGFSIHPSKVMGDAPYAQAQYSVGPAGSDLKVSSRSKGKDLLGAFSNVELKAQAGFVSGSLSIHQYASEGVTTASLEAFGANREWWKGFRFGLSGEGTAVLRISLPGFSHGMAGYMSEEWWSHPSFPRKTSELLPLTRFLTWKEKDGLYGCLLPLCGGDAVSYLKGVPGGMELRVSTFEEGRLQAKAPLFLLGFGKDPYELVKKIFASALKFLGHPAKTRLQKKFPEPFKRLGWCTWDAFMRELSSKEMIKQLDHFRKAGFPLGFVLVDDGWYEIKDDQMMDSREDKSKLPEGMARFVQRVKRDYGVPYVGVWHALTGYWAGIHPQNRLQGDMKENLLETKGWPPVPPLDNKKAFRFWNAWHGWLKRAGVDFVKVDGQGHIPRYSRNLMPSSKASAQVQAALQKSVGTHFNGNMINCMSMGPEQMWNWVSSNVTRSSDDYILNCKECDPAVHARLNAYNSFWLSQISWCDWDMFWSASPNAQYHQSLRALSGGPVYVSDKVGAARMDKIWPLVLKDGRLLRCDGVGMPTEDCLLEDPLKAGVLKIMNLAGGAGIIGLFHGSKKGTTAAASFRPSDIRGLEGKEFAVLSHLEKKGRKLGVRDSWGTRLRPRQASVFVVQPLQNGFAPIGLVNKIISPQTVSHWISNTKEAVVSLLEGGDFAAYSRRKPLSLTAGGRKWAFHYEKGWLHAEIPGDKPVKVTVSF